MAHFLRPIDCDVDTAIDVIKAACCLHNYLRTKLGAAILTPESEDENEPMRALITHRPTNRRSAAFETREKFVSYFNQ